MMISTLEESKVLFSEAEKDRLQPTGQFAVSYLPSPFITASLHTPSLTHLPRTPARDH